MAKQVMRLVIFMLFLLSLLTWFYIPYLTAWELSIVTTQLGCYFALLTIACLLSLAPWRLFKPPFRPLDVLFIALGVVAVGSFVAPIVTAFEDHPGELSVVRLFALQETKTEMKRFTFQAANGTTPLNLDYYPAVHPRKTTPWILVIHGGGWINGDSEQLPNLNWHLAKQGYAVISIDYRLSPGWLWPSPKDDATKALDFIRAHATEWQLDPARWAILGRSAGAQIAGVVAYSLHGDERPKGFVSFYGPSDLTFGYDVGKEDDILKSRTLLRGFLGGKPEDSKELYASSSEMNAVTKDACPTVLIHGLEDTLVWYKHSERLFKVLQDNGIDSKLVLMRFGPHGFDFFFNGPEAQVSTTVVDQFLARVLPL
jgi:acetyl esterase/lipase